MSGKGWQWPLVILGLLAGGAGANIGLMLIATHDASFAVEPDYYQKALAWDRTMAQEERNATLGWSAAVGFERAREPGQVRLTARVVDRRGAPIRGATVTVETFHSARASQILAAGLEPQPGGEYAARLPMRRAGLWEVRLRVERGSQVFTQTLTGELAGAP